MSRQSLEGTAPRTGPGEEREKLGLALSGGGFRAAFFHIGVLAQMAMLGLLRHVKIISTVSGGSIIGALYYLHVKQLLEAKADDEITNQDYKAIVEQIEGDFLRAVQSNIRTRTFLNPVKNIRMSMANYSRSDRIGELYDQHFYRPVIDPNGSKMIEMRDLKIQSKGDKADFYPLTDNVGRKAKVPILLINATTLNTGHNWRFEASRMGEPLRKGDVAQEIDKNLRLGRPKRYKDIILKQQNIELGLAVAASGSVPGLLHPLAISDLYPDGIRVQLVDGGVHDNQGIQGLLDMRCTHFVVSDASGQLGDEPDPATGIVSILGRSSSILGDRVREEQLFRLLQSDKPVAFMHLRKGLPVDVVCYIGPDGQPAEEPVRRQLLKATSKSFGVDEQVQDLLSRIRTDLDSLTEVEAYSLMLDGYLMSKEELRETEGIKDLIPDEPTVDTPRWDFLEIKPWMAHPTDPYRRQLEVASHQLLKVFLLSWRVRLVTFLAVVVILLGLWKLLGDEIKAFLFRSVTVSQLLVAAVVLGLGFIIPKLSLIVDIPRFVRSPTEFLVRLATRALLPAIGSLFVGIYLWIFDPLFLGQGKLKRLGPPPRA